MSARGTCCNGKLTDPAPCDGGGILEGKARVPAAPEQCEAERSTQSAFLNLE